MWQRNWQAACVDDGIQVLFLQSLGRMPLKPVPAHYDTDNRIVHYIFHVQSHKVD
ncbi:hypothetical protein EC5412_2072 [Escherichia coli 5412]|nr:hypothetical protein EC5412_2072 [Escherichia coli 5412]